MSKYFFEAIDSDGRRAAGSIEAESIAAASRALEQQGLNLITIHLDDEAEKSKIEAEAHSRLEFKVRIEQALQLRHEWLPAFRAFCDDLPSGSAKNATSQLLTTLEAKLDADSLLKHTHASALLPLLSLQKQRTFDSERLVDWLAAVQFVEQQKRKKRRAFAYPALLIGLAAAVTVFLAAFVVPIFKDMFEEFGIQIPPPTLFVIRISELLTKQQGFLTLAVLAGSLLLLISIVIGWRKLALTNRMLQGFVSGTTNNLQAMSTLSGTLGELLRFGAPVPDALGIAGVHCRHRSFEQLANRLGRDLSAGISIRESKACRQLPPLLIHAIELSQDNSPGIELLSQLNSIYRERAQSRIDWFAAMLPASAMVVVGLVVGFVTVALFLPLVSLVSSLV